MAMIMRAINRAQHARSSDLGARAAQRTLFCEYVARAEFGGAEIRREHACTPHPPRSTLFPYTTLFRSAINRAQHARSSDLGARAAQRTLFCEYVARAEFGGAGKGEVFAHSGIVELRDMPSAIKKPARLENPSRGWRQLILPRQIPGRRADESIQLTVAGLHRALRNGRQPVFSRRREGECVEEFRQGLLSRRAVNNPLDRFREGSGAHCRLLPWTRCSLAQSVACLHPPRCGGRTLPGSRSPVRSR